MAGQPKVAPILPSYQALLVSPAPQPPNTLVPRSFSIQSTLSMQNSRALEFCQAIRPRRAAVIEDRTFLALLVSTLSQVPDYLLLYLLSHSNTFFPVSYLLIA